MILVQNTLFIKLTHGSPLGSNLMCKASSKSLELSGSTVTTQTSRKSFRLDNSDESIENSEPDLGNPSKCYQ